MYKIIAYVIFLTLDVGCTALYSISDLILFCSGLYDNQGDDLLTFIAGEVCQVASDLLGDIQSI